jgi:UDP-N-acetyl-D-mannosaminuronic acid dehydrogenase
MIAVIGCGRVGLPLALCLAARGQAVLGVDSDRHLVAMVAEGRLPFQDAFAAELLPTALGRVFQLTSNLEQALLQAETFIVCVGTPLAPSAPADQGSLLATVEAILAHQAGRARASRPPLIIIRSTVVPGTTEGIIRAAERRNGLTAGKDFLIAFCPERTLEGNASELLELPQIIGAADEETASAARAVFATLEVPFVFTGIREAELAKLFDNAYRYVGFALANELMMIARANGARIHEALRAANEGYKRGGIPGPGFAGGPCLCKDGFLLTERFPGVDLLLSSWKLNEGLPEYFVQQVERVRPLSRAVVLGLGFKADSDDPRHSLGVRLLEIIRLRGVAAVAHDPAIARTAATSDLAAVLDGAGEVFVAVPHREYRRLAWDNLVRSVRPDCIIADPWRVWGQGDVVVDLAASTRP